jgi:hypothetical protein
MYTMEAFQRDYAKQHFAKLTLEEQRVTAWTGTNFPSFSRHPIDNRHHYEW